jgi:hypothetical protein
MNVLDKHMNAIMAMDTITPIFRVIVSKRANSVDFDAWVEFKCIYPSDTITRTNIYSGENALIAVLRLERALNESHLKTVREEDL